jgi:hypothetical protein
VSASLRRGPRSGPIRPWSGGGHAEVRGGGSTRSERHSDDHPSEDPGGHVTLPPGGADDVAGDHAGPGREHGHDHQGDPRAGSGEGQQQGGRPADHEQPGGRPGRTPPSRERCGERRTQHAAGCAQCQHEADGSRGDVELAHEVEHQQGLVPGQTQVRQAAQRAQPPEVAVREHEAQARPDLRPQRLDDLRGRVPGDGSHAPEADRGDEVAHDVDDESGGGRHHLDQEPGEAGSGDLGARLGPDETTVRHLQGRAWDDLRHERRVRGAEEHGAAPAEQGHDQELRQPQHAEPPGHRHAGDHQRRRQVGTDHHAPGWQPVDPGPGRQPDEQPR